MRYWFCIIAFFAASVGCNAEPVRFGSFLVDDERPSTIVLAGPVRHNAPIDFRRALKAYPQIRTLALHSEGGDVTAGLLVAQEVFDRGLDTRIAPVSYCYSACAYIFFAGAARNVEGQLGVHQIVGHDQYTLQVAISDMLDTLAAFDVPAPVISEMLRTAPEEMRVYDADEAERIGLNRGNVSLVSVSTPIDDVERGSALLLLADMGGGGAVPFSGSVAWHREMDSDGLYFVVAQVAISSTPQAMGVKVFWRKNTDPSLPAEALVHVDFTDREVVTLAGILTKQEELVPGVALAGAPARLADGSFVFALTDDPNEATLNSIALRDPFIDLAFVLASGRNAILTFEKDGAAEVMFRETLETWVD
ncbi:MULTISPECIES: hypothetical protein [Devosia]|uniref:hypothetical protein n=1 Tax=Devosia TaxID=46913 RepID=UPI000CE97474|nr:MULTISPECIES: hypothetical protein [Devosia]AVF02917.1 hypothetical protein C4375_03650 [Devosia sp. I507]